MTGFSTLYALTFIHPFRLIICRRIRLGYIFIVRRHRKFNMADIRGYITLIHERLIFDLLYGFQER